MFQEDMDQEKHNKLNDIFQALERLRDEYEELEQMDSDMGSSGVGDLTDQLTTMRKHMVMGGTLAWVTTSSRTLEARSCPVRSRLRHPRPASTPFSTSHSLRTPNPTRPIGSMVVQPVVRSRSAM